MSNVMSFTGHVARDAEVRYLPSGQAVLNVTVGNSVGFGDKQKTNWIRCALFGKKAEGQLKDYLLKGQAVFCSGELSQSEYRAQDGSTKTSLELNCNVLDLVGGKREGGNNQHSGAQQQQRPAQNQQNTQQSVPRDNFNDPYDDDIPF
jgi:single-strand DNA-binding protein